MNARNQDKLRLGLEEKAEKAGAALGLDSGQVGTLQSVAWGVYEECSYDLEPDLPRKKLCRRSTIMEIVTDAGRLEQAVRRHLGLASGFELDAENPLVKACRNYDLIDDLIGPAFVAAYYEAGSS